MASVQEVLHRSAPGLLAWLDLHLRPSPARLHESDSQTSEVGPSREIEI